MPRRPETFENLMPVINPNLDEIVVEGKNEPITLQVKKSKNADIFQRKENVIISKTTQPKTKDIEKNVSRKKSVRFEVAEKDEELPVDMEDLPRTAVQPKKKRNYDHLKKARAKALIVRKKKAEERKKLRDAEKAQKLVLKEEKKNLRKEKNRERARDNYYKQKDLKTDKKEEKEMEEKIEKIENTAVKKEVSRAVNNGSMDYSQFAKFMRKYEDEKSLMKTQSKSTVQRKVSAPIKIPIEKTKQYLSPHPPNYYNPNRRRRADVNSLFKL